MREVDKNFFMSVRDLLWKQMGVISQAYRDGELAGQSKDALRRRIGSSSKDLRELIESFLEKMMRSDTLAREAYRWLRYRGLTDDRARLKITHSFLVAVDELDSEQDTLGDFFEGWRDIVHWGLRTLLNDMGGQHVLEKVEQYVE